MKRNNSDKNINQLIGILPVRIAQVLLVAVSYFALHIINGSMSILILAMIDKGDPNHYNWTSTHVSLILNVAGFSMYLFMIPFNYLPKLMHYRLITLLAIVILGLCYAIIPFVSTLGWWCVFLLQAVSGIMFAAFAPLAQNTISKWAPVAERTRMMLLVSCCVILGTMFGTSISGIIVKRLGWQCVFIIIGLATCIWAFVPAFMMVNSPENYSSLSDQERALYPDLKNEIGNEKKKFLNPPWLKIITSPAVWAINIATLGNQLSLMILITHFPLFLNGVMKFDTEKIGLLTSLPILVMWISSFPFCYLADYVIKDGKSIAFVRKSFTTIALWGQAAILLILCYVNDSSYIIVCIIIAAICSAGMTAGSNINHIDISPSFAGSVHSFTGLVTCPNYVLTPLVWAYIVPDITSAKQWHQSFVFMAVIFFIENIFFIIFAKGEPRDWDISESQSTRKKSVIED